jgi:hypothetical protein
MEGRFALYRMTAGRELGKRAVGEGTGAAVVSPNAGRFSSSLSSASWFAWLRIDTEMSATFPE